uniref:LOW QUALITY PROTEIN: protein MOR1-like n=1 Tax=Nicotiana tabacum TaxID=4097 RepID=A0A1S4BWM6_TOBAC|nr:PREDICTED: LOW QUALITY PROTEIN: protein MOR1-like [Nicotiana tabacum]
MSEDEKLLKEAKKLPWDERFAHKNWKVRNDANIDLAAVCDSITDPKDPRLREFGPLFRKTVADSNAPVQEKALDALICYLKAADADAGRYAKEVCDAVVVKCLTGRPKTVEKAQMVFLLWIELEAVEAFLDAMEKAIKNKVAKAVVPAIDVMFQALSEFGAKIIPPKRILKMLPELFDHQDQNVRASSKGLTLELCRWISKETVKSILFEKMRDTMKKELEAELVNVTGTAKPTRKIRSEQDKEPELEVVSDAVAAGPSEESAADVPQEIDEYDLVDPVDILIPLEKTGFWEGVKAAKWSERKEAVAELTKLASTKKIAPGDFAEICRTLKKLITDVNIAVAVEAIQAIGNLARGLRTHFSGSSRFLLPVLLEKLKEKKPTLTDALTQTLQAMHKSGCLILTDIVEDVKTATKNKVPLVRSLTLNWVTFCIETSNKAVILKAHKEYVPICMESLNDGTPEVRDAAFSALAAVAKSVGMRPLEKSLEKLDDVRKKKLSEMIGGSGGDPVSTSSSGAVPSSGGIMSSTQASTGSLVKRSAASMLSGKKPVQAAPPSKKGASAKSGTNKRGDGATQLKASKPVEVEDVEPAEMSLEEIESKLGSLIQPETITQLKSAVWKESLSSGGLDSLPREDISGKITPALLKGLESSDWKARLESIETVNKILEEANKRIQPTGTGELFGALRGRLCDSNKNLVIATLSTVGGVASAMGPAVEKSSKGILSDILKCLGDNKKHMRECTLNTLDSWLAAVHLDKMVPYITGALTDAKLGAEGRKDLFDWLSKQLTGMKEFPDAVHLLKPVASAMTDKSADVRKAAEACFGELLRVCGQEMVSKNLKDIQGPALAIVVERLRPYGVLQETFDLGRTSSTGTTSKVGSKIGKSTGPAERASRHGNRAGASRAIPTRNSRQETLMSVQDISVQSQALINVKDSHKGERERIVVRRFKFEEPRLEQIQDLESDLMKYFREDLHRRLLSTDFKKQVDGIEMLQKALPSIAKELIEVLDIVLRWFVLRFCESNTSCLLKVLEFLPELFEMLRNEGYMMTEAEAAIFLPCLVEKSGHNIEKVREKMRELTKQIIHAYSAAKTFPYILEGLRSRSNRTRIECADLVGYLLDNHEAEIGGQLKSLKDVANLTAERDGETRKAALNTLATGYKILGDDIWKYLGKLTEAQRSMLDDRFKWKAREMDKRREGRPGEARAALRRSVRDNGSDIAEPSGEVSRSLAGPILNRDIYNNTEFPMERIVNLRPVSGTMGPSDWNEALDIIASDSPEQSVEGMKVVCHLLAVATNDPEGSAMDDIVKDADKLVSCLANKVAKTFDFSLMGASSRSCKYVLNTLMQTFQNKTLAHAVRESTLDILITELLLWLLDERVPRMDDGSQLLKALNVLMLKILDNADRTSSFVVLIKLLRPLDPSRWPSPATDESLVIRNQKFSDLVVKCLIKLTKVLQSTIYDVDLDRILQSIHIYLQELGMDEIRRRAGADDKPLRMVKTVLHELVKLRGTAIKGHLSMVPIDMQPPPIILAYIDLNLQTLAAARMLTPSVPGQTHWGDSAANNPAPATHNADAQLKQELAAIFKKIGDKQTCTIGLYELYRITQLYPKVDIFAQLQNASEAFRTYIRDGLAQMEKNAAAGRTPSSVPMSTPPPSSLNLSSPKFGTLSPVNTNPLNDAKSVNNKVEPSQFSLPPSYGEDDRGGNALLSRGLSSEHLELRHQLGEQRNDRLPSGVTSGTLEAIRERMKSMSLAATGGNPDPSSRTLMSMNGNVSHMVSTQAPGIEHSSIENSIQSGVLPMDEKALSGLQARMERLKSGSMEF